MKIHPNEIEIQGEAHQRCDEHGLWFKAFFGTEQCPMCDNDERIEELEGEVSGLTTENEELEEELDTVIDKLNAIKGMK